MNEAFIGDLLYRAYMIDAITDAEVRQACAMMRWEMEESLNRLKSSAVKRARGEGKA